MKAVYIPVSLTHLNEYEKYVVHKIVSQGIILKRSPGSWVRLKAAYLNNVIGRRYRQVLRELQQKAIIEVRNHYVVGKRSRSYRLSAAYQHGQLVFRTLTNKSLEKRIAAAEKQRQQRAKSKANGTAYKQCIADLLSPVLQMEHLSVFRR